MFVDDGRRLGVGRGRRIVSQVLGWLRAGNDHLALVTNGRQWRLLFAGLDYDAWCEWDLDLWFEEGTLSPQVTALRTLLSPALWTPESEDAASPLLQAIRGTRKGQAELSEVLGERVREAVEILIRGHGQALSALVEGPEEADIAEYRAYLEDVAGVSSAEVPFGDDETPPGATPQDIYRAACRVAMRLVVILFAESRELLPRDNALYHESYGLNGLLEQLERGAARGQTILLFVRRLGRRWTPVPDERESAVRRLQTAPLTLSSQTRGRAELPPVYALSPIPYPEPGKNVPVNDGS